MPVHQAQQLADDRLRKVVPSGRLGLTRARHIERLDTMPLDEASGDLGCTIRGDLGSVDQPVRAALLDALDQSRLGATFQLSEVENQRAVAVENVLDHALAVAAVGHLGQRVAIGDHAVSRLAARRTPAAAGEARRERGVEGAAVDAGLAAGDDLVQGHGLGSIRLGFAQR